MSPAGKGKAQCFAVRRGEIKKRLDAYSNQPRFRELFARLRQLKMPVVELKEVADYIFTGITPKSGGDAYTDDRQTGIPFIRSGEITEDGLVVTESEICLKPEIHNGIMRRSRLRKGDVLIAIVGATIGQTGIYDRDTEANINQAIAGVRLDTRRILPKYLVAFLKTATGQSILDFLKRPVARANINLDEIGTIVIPLPTQDRQSSLLRLLEDARCEMAGSLVQADALLSGLDAFLLDRLGVKMSQKQSHLVFAIKVGQVGTERFDTHFHRPNFRHLLAEIQRKPNKPLGKIVDFSKTQRDPASFPGQTFRYIEISGVNRYTGEITANETPTSEAPSRARMLVSEGDIIVSLTRPHHGSIGYIDTEYDQCIASTGFAVIHEYKDPALLPQYLLAVLRSSLSLQQMLQRSSGGNYPAITEEELERILIPIPDESTQREIVEELHERRMNARRLREAAAREWEAAKARFEAKLLGQEAKV
jgi:restriction endonuclease S subunit